MKRELKELERIINAPSINKGEVVNAMVNMRMILEGQNLKSQFPILNLYCNWTLHTKIDGSNIAFRILENITDSMIAHNTDPKNAQNFSDAVIEGLNLHKLQLEIIALGAIFGADLSKLKIYNRWWVFGALLLQILIERPLKFPSTITKLEARKIFDSIEMKTTNSGRLVNGVIELFFVQEGDEIYWSIKTLNYVNKAIDIVGLMAIITQEMVDKNSAKRNTKTP